MDGLLLLSLFYLDSSYVLMLVVAVHSPYFHSYAPATYLLPSPIYPLRPYISSRLMTLRMKQLNNVSSMAPILLIGLMSPAKMASFGLPYF